jgi:CO/xanthine dehydrogenase Mo-binding subunit
MEMYASTVMWDGDGKLTVYDKTQGVQNVQRYLCGVFDMKPDDVRVMSPFMGGGFGMALHEETLLDHRFGRIMNANIAEYHVPVNADVHDIEVIFVDEPDAMVNPLGVKEAIEVVCELNHELLRPGQAPSKRRSKPRD